MSDGRFSSKPLRSGKARDIAWQDGEFTAEGRLLTDAARAFVESSVVQREITSLLTQQFPAIGALKCAPLHRKTPDIAKEFGQPLTSATLVQEYLIGLLFLRVAGWIFLFFGALFLLGAIVTTIAGLSNPPNNQQPDPLLMGAVIAGFGIFVGGAGAWFGIFRSRVITEMCWFCPRGMIWITDGFFDWYTWEEVREIYCQLETDRPAIGIRFDGNVSMISFRNDEASGLMVEYIENRASAACAPMMLNLIADGGSARFRDWRMSRSTLHSRDTEIPWRDVADLDVQDRNMRIRCRDGANVTISLEEIPFPSLFIALARGIHGYTRELPA